MKRDDEGPKISCPRCKKQTRWQGNPDRPFCSEKCRMIDLGAWASEEYRIPEKKVDPEELDNLIEFPKKSE